MNSPTLLITHPDVVLLGLQASSALSRLRRDPGRWRAVPVPATAADFRARLGRALTV